MTIGLKHLLTALAIGLTALCANGVSSNELSDILRRLDKELARRDSYIRQRETAIDSMRNRIPKVATTDKFEILFDLGDHYSAFNIDSAIWFYRAGENQARAMHKDSIATRFALRKATYMPLLLLFNEAQSVMDSINPANLNGKLKTEYYEAQRQLNFYMSSFYTEQPSLHKQYLQKEREAQAALLTLLPPSSSKYKFNLGESYYFNKEYSKAQSILNRLLDEIDENNPIYARVCYRLADIAKARGEMHGYPYYLALSALSDTKCATLEVSSLQELGSILYRNNDIERAHDYLSIALKNAVDCNVSLRMIQTAQSIPIIDSAHKAALKASRTRTYIVIAVLAILLISLIFVVSQIKAKNVLLNRMKDKLEIAGNTKDIYIAQFLNLCSTYMEKLKEFNKVVNRKISAGKVDDLFKLTKSGRFIEEQSKEFYEIFDDAFLHIYPSFVSDVNSLLHKDKQIMLREGEKLNTDLRILAFMRMGIDETSRIAQMLNYSVYTIYTYRNKLKNRAINRDSFEDDVLKIKSIT